MQEQKSSLCKSKGLCNCTELNTIIRILINRYTAPCDV